MRDFDWMGQVIRALDAEAGRQAGDELDALHRQRQDYIEGEEVKVPLE